jgi:hypothetical protein
MLQDIGFGAVCVSVYGYCSTGHTETVFIFLSYVTLPYLTGLSKFELHKT